MEVPSNNSILSVNSHFFKVFKRYIEKKGKNESVADELEWINSQLLVENRKICENSVNFLIHVGNSNFGFALNSLISALPRASTINYDLIGDGIFKLMRLSDQKYGIIDKAHPGLLLISENSERMLYLSKKIEEILNNK